MTRDRQWRKWKPNFSWLKNKMSALLAYCTRGLGQFIRAAVFGLLVLSAVVIPGGAAAACTCVVDAATAAYLPVIDNNTWNTASVLGYYSQNYNPSGGTIIDMLVSIRDTLTNQMSNVAQGQVQQTTNQTQAVVDSNWQTAVANSTANFAAQAATPTNETVIGDLSLSKLLTLIAQGVEAEEASYATMRAQALLNPNASNTTARQTQVYNSSCYFTSTSTGSASTPQNCPGAQATYTTSDGMTISGGGQNLFPQIGVSMAMPAAVTTSTSTGIPAFSMTNPGNYPGDTLRFIAFDNLCSRFISPNASVMPASSNGTAPQSGQVLSAGAAMNTASKGITQARSCFKTLIKNAAIGSQAAGSDTTLQQLSQYEKQFCQVAQNLGASGTVITNCIGGAGISLMQAKAIAVNLCTDRAVASASEGAMAADMRQNNNSCNAQREALEHEKDADEDKITGAISAMATEAPNPNPLAQPIGAGSGP